MVRRVRSPCGTGECVPGRGRGRALGMVKGARYIRARSAVRANRYCLTEGESRGSAFDEAAGVVPSVVITSRSAIAVSLSLCLSLLARSA